jgi:hypothetical protein
MGQEDVTSMIKRLNFFDSNRNKMGKGIERRDYELDRRENLVLDSATGLIWQYSGLPDMSYNDAQQYIRKIKDAHFCGYNDWRLPTLEEAMSLVKPSRNESQVFIDSQFDDELWWIWTADKSDSETAWVVDYKLGYCRLVNIKINYFYVRAVRTYSEVTSRIRLRSQPYDNFREEVVQPMSLADSIQRFKREHDSTKTVFVMMKFFKDDDPYKDVKNVKLRTLYKTISEELDNYLIHVVKADDDDYASNLWDNVKVYLNGCNYGIAVLENLYSDEINPNVALEYGYMVAKVEDERKILLLKEKSFTNIQADLVGKLWKEFDIDDVESIKTAIRNWMNSLRIQRIKKF